MTVLAQRDSDLSKARQFRAVNDALYGYLVKFADPKPNDTAMSISGIVSTEEEDQQGDIVLTQGIALDDHRRNPVVMLNHGLGASKQEAGLLLSIGKAEDPAGNYTVIPEAHQLRATTYFAPTLDGEQTYILCREGFLRGLSIGAKPLQADYRQRPDNANQGAAVNRFPGILIAKCNLAEYSHCPVGENRSALIDMFGDGTKSRKLAGKPLSGALLKSLHLPPAPVRVVSGFDPEKLMNAKRFRVTMTKADGLEESRDYVPLDDEEDEKRRKAAELDDDSGDGLTRKELDLDREGGDKTGEVETGKEGGEKKLDKSLDSPNDPNDPVVDDQRPAGAKFLSSLYAHKMQLADLLDKEGPQQENEAIKSLIEEERNGLTDKADSLCDMYREHYPDHGELAKKSDEMDEEEPKETVEKSWHPSVVRLKRKLADFHKRQQKPSGITKPVQETLTKSAELIEDLAKKSNDRSQRIAAGLMVKSLVRAARAPIMAADAEELAILKSQNEKLQKLLTESLAREEQARRQKRLLRTGR